MLHTAFTTWYSPGTVSHCPEPVNLSCKPLPILPAKHMHAQQLITALHNRKPQISPSRDQQKPFTLFRRYTLHSTRSFFCCSRAGTVAMAVIATSIAVDIRGQNALICAKLGSARDSKHTPKSHQNGNFLGKSIILAYYRR